MESDKKLPEGPDFSADGLALSELADGAMVLGHVNDDPILVIRRGDVIFAAGAKCTHYGGPLAKGLQAGDTFRCPWHHAPETLAVASVKRDLENLEAELAMQEDDEAALQRMIAQ